MDPSQTHFALPDAIKWSGRVNGSPPRSGEMATLYGGLDQPGPYLVLMKWYADYLSAPMRLIASRSFSPTRGGLTVAPTSIRTTRFRFPPADSSDAPLGPGTMTESSRSEPTVIGFFRNCASAI
jgi:hypothetical protein